jgi:hypothetical protein
LTSPTHVGQRSPAGTDHRMIVYPNPGHGPRQVSVHAGGAGVVRIVVHDMLGRMITTLYDGFMPEGTHNYVFDPAGLAAGQYQVMLQSERGLLRNAVTVLR